MIGIIITVSLIGMLIALSILMWWYARDAQAERSTEEATLAYLLWDGITDDILGDAEQNRTNSRIEQWDAVVWLGERGGVE